MQSELSSERARDKPHTWLLLTETMSPQTHRCQLVVVGALVVVVVAATCASLVAANSRAYELSQELTGIKGFSRIYELYSSRDPEMGVARNLVEDAGFRSTSRSDFDNQYYARIEQPCYAIGTFKYDYGSSIGSGRGISGPLAQLNKIAAYCDRMIKEASKTKVYNNVLSLLRRRG